MKRDSFERALDVLTDLSLPEREALRQFARISKRWKAASCGFALWMGGYIRSEKQRRAHEATALAVWCDDGGRA